MALMRLDTSGLDSLIAKIDKLGGEVERSVEKALEKAGRQIGDDTLEALAKPHLPRQGKYSSGDTEKTVIRDPKTHWDGLQAWVPIGFNFAQPGAGGFLIAGTPRMAPDPELRKMYKQKKYTEQIAEEMYEELWQEYLRILES